MTEPAGILGDIERALASRVMAPTVFRRATALVTVSATIGRGLRFTLGGSERTPHIWGLLISPAGGMKSSSSAPAGDIVRRARGDVAILPSRFSPEGFYDALAERNAGDGLWDIGEISAFLANSRRDYMKGVLEDLCDIWDGRPVGRRLRNEKITVVGAAPTAVATGRASDFRDAGGRQVWESGFGSRFLLFRSAENPAYIGLRGLSNDPMWKRELAESLKPLTRWRQAAEPTWVQFTESAIEEWEEYDRAWMEESASVPAILHGWAKRRGIQALKLAILHAASDGRAPEVGVEDIAWGVELSALCYASVGGLLDDDVGLDREDVRRGDVLDRARQLARENDTAVGVVTERALLRSTRLIRNVRHLRELIELWQAAGLIMRGVLRRPGSPPSPAIAFPDLCPHMPPEWKERL